MSLPEADIVEGLVINAVGLVGVLNELMDGKGGVVGFDDSVRDFRGGDDGECVHDSVWVLLTDLGDQESSHSRASSTSEGVGKLESLNKSC